MFYLDIKNRRPKRCACDKGEIKVYQFYILELEQYADGSYGNTVHYAYDEDEATAKLKGESKYYEV